MSNPISAASQLFDERIGDITSALGDPTRRAIYIAVREAADPLTSSHIADLFNLHPNVARHHLDKLATDGYLDIDRRRPSGKSGPGAGRPAKCYTPSGKGIDLHFPTRRNNLLVELLVRIVERSGAKDISGIAESVGREYGQELADQIGSPEDAEYETAVKAIAKAMTGLGFVMSADPKAGRLLTSSCPFGEAASNHPEVMCSLDKGLVTGLFAGMSQPCEPEMHPHPEDNCITVVPVSISRR